MKRFLFALIIFSESCYSMTQMPSVKVRVGHALPKVSISGMDLRRHLLSMGDIKQYAGKKKLLFNCHSMKNKKKIKDSKLLAYVSSPAGLLTWEKRRYRGDLLVTTSVEQEACDLINKVSLENYLNSLLAKEMRGDWPLEALKAQAVAARTYAYHKIRTKQVAATLGVDVYYDLESSEKHQVAGSLFDETSNTTKASSYTSGEVLLTSDGNLTPIFFHSKCGGKTWRPNVVWDNNVKGYDSRPCPYCHKHGKKDWKLEMDQKEFTALLEKLKESFADGPKLPMGETLSEKVLLVQDQAKNSLLRYYQQGNLYTMKKSAFRKYLGRKKLPSNFFELKREDDKIVFSGKGYGHGVGMCQFGAYEMARRGMSYKKILAHYFPNHKLVKIYK